jgi:hypothetical protein
MMDIETINPTTLPSVPLNQKANLPMIPAVYFALRNDDTVVYIGKAVCLKTRWAAHHRYAQLLCDHDARIAWLEVVDTSTLMDIERECIAHFQPKYNRQPANMPYFEITKTPDLYGDSTERFDTTAAAVLACHALSNYEDIFAVWQQGNRAAGAVALVFQESSYYKEPSK